MYLFIVFNMFVMSEVLYFCQTVLEVSDVKKMSTSKNLHSATYNYKTIINTAPSHNAVLVLKKTSVLENGGIRKQGNREYI